MIHPAPERSPEASPPLDSSAPPPTILQIADFGGPYSGNFIASLLRLRDHVHRRLGLRMAFVFSEVAQGRPWLDRFVADGTPVFFIDRRAPVWQRARALEELAARCSATLLHSHFTGFDMESLWVARRRNARIVWHFHSDFWGRLTLKQRIKDRIKLGGLGSRWLDCAIAVSEGVAGGLIRRGLPASRIITIHNGIDEACVAAHSRYEREALKQRYRIPVEQTVFLLFGWEPWVKGADVFLRAAEMVRDRGETGFLCLLVAGETSLAPIRRMAAGSPWVRVLPPQEHVSELYAIADAFVLASRWEAFSYSIGEAMASGLPVICSDLPHLEAVYGGAGAGFMVFRCGDAGDLARMLARIVRTPPDELHDLGRGNREFVERRLTVDRWCEDVLEVYRSLLHTQARGRGAESKRAWRRERPPAEEKAGIEDDRQGTAGDTGERAPLR